MTELRLDAADAPIDRVTLYEDRAEVTRLLNATLDSGPFTVVLSNLTALLDPARLRVEADDLVVDDVKSDSAWREDDSDGRARLRQQQEQLFELDRTCVRADAAFRRAATRREQSERMMQRYCAQLSARLWKAADGAPSDYDVDGDGLPAVGEGPIDEGFGLLERRLREADRELDEHRRRYEHARRQLDDLASALRDPAEPPFRLTCDVTLQGFCEQAGTRVIAVAYVVPCALWRPTHDAHLEGAHVAWTTLGTVWQRTGEDWEHVSLTLSTARPSASADVPHLDDDRLRLRTKSWIERRQVTVQHREASVPTKALDGAAPGVDDGGEAQTLAVTGRVHVPSDGLPHVLQVATTMMSASTDHIAVPELDPHVYLRAQLLNDQPSPLLAGPVTLRQDGAFIGTGDVAYVGPREAFEMSFGSDDRFEVRSEKKRLDEDRLLGRDRRHFVHEVTLRSHGAEPATLLVQLRLPVSEVKQVKVVPTEEHCSHGVPRTDDSGRFVVPVEVRPGAPTRVSVGFSFDTSGDVVLPDPW